MPVKKTSRREFLKVSATAGLTFQLPKLGMTMEDRQYKASPDPLIGIQIAPFNLLDEGVEFCLDILQEAGVNALFCYSHTYHQSYDKPNNVFADHGIPIKGLRNRRLPHRWVKTHEGFYQDTLLGHETNDPTREYQDRDIFKELIEPARKSGMRIYARILEASANRKDLIPNYSKVLTKDIFDQPGRGPCWNHPDYRAWLVGTVRDLVTHYELSGLQYGAERTGPIPYLLDRGLVPTCFCEYCIARNQAKGIDAQRARIGYTELYHFIKKVERNEVQAGMVQEKIYGFWQRFPEILAWNFEWYQADNEIHGEIYTQAKRLKPQLEVGRHVDHQRSSWDIWYRSAVPYAEMADTADFVKPILYHDILGPRLKHWVIRERKRRAGFDFTEADLLRQFYAQFGYDPQVMPDWATLDKQGLGVPYVEKETKRCVEGLAGRAKVYAGIGVDVPWHLPEGGMAVFPSPPEVLEEAVFKVFEAGADGILISREYEEIRLDSLKTIGKSVANWKRR